MLVREIPPQAFLLVCRHNKGHPLFDRKRIRFSPWQDVCSPQRNPLLRYRHAYLSAAEGKAASALLLWKKDTAAWFSMPPCASADTAEALLREALRISREWGCSEIIGPVSGDGTGFGLGICIEGSGSSAPWHPGADAYLQKALAQTGFVQAQTLLELEISLSNRRNPYAGAGEWAMRRRGVCVQSLPLASRATFLLVERASKDERAFGSQAFERVYGRICTLAKHARALVATQNGVPIGWALFVPEKNRVRLLHIQVLPHAQSGVCAAALLDTAWQLSVSLHAHSVLVSTIDDKNPASLRIARNCGGKVVRSYGIFAQKDHI